MNESEEGFAESHFQSWKTLVLVTTFYPSEGLYFLKKFTLVTTFYPIDASNLAARTFQGSFGPNCHRLVRLMIATHLYQATKLCFKIEDSMIIKSYRSIIRTH